MADDGAAAASEGKRPAVFVTVEELRPGTSGHNLAVKVVNSKLVLQRPLPDGRNARQMRIAECIVGDATGVIVFTARNEQGQHPSRLCAMHEHVPRLPPESARRARPSELLLSWSLHLFSQTELSHGGAASCS